MKVLIKAMRPHRQKVLTEDGEEMRLQQWANKAASSALRGAGGDASGEQFTQARDALMREAVANPNEHGLKFLGERMPFDGQELEESLSEPDYGNSPEEQKVFEHLMSLNPEEQEVLSNNRTPDLFDSEGKLRDGMPPEEEFNPDAEAEHMKRIMTSRQVPMRDALSLLKNEPYDWQGQEYDTHCPKCQKGIYRQDEDDLFMIQNAGMCTDCMMPKKAMTSRQVPMRDAWSVLKNDFFNPPEVPCAKCGKPTEPMMYYGSNQMGPQHNTLCEECEDNTMMEDQ